jgi:uncharacterized membrane protein YgaE (UPF0421/DUF939 family)
MVSGTRPSRRARAAIVVQRLQQRMRADLGRCAQATVGAALAWAIAHDVFGHPQPFFAPMAVVVCLAVDVGARGPQAVNMLAGVFAGVALGEIAIRVIDFGFWQVMPVVALPMLLGAAFRLRPVLVIQTAVSALLVIGMHSKGTGLERIFDAAIGSAIALICTQLLFPPRPGTLVATQARSMLSALATGLQDLAQAAAAGDQAETARAAGALRKVEQTLGDFIGARNVGSLITRTSWMRGGARAEYDRAARHLSDLDLLFASIVLLAQTMTERRDGTPPPPPPALLDALRELAAVIGLRLATDKPDETVRAEAVRQAQALADRLPDSGDTACMLARLAALHLARVVR